MTNRARPTWPEGAADSSKSQRTSQGGKQSTGPAGPASNGRSGAAPSGNGQQRTGAAPNGQRPSEFRPQPRPAAAGGPGQAGAPVRPQQQPGPSTPGRQEPWSPTHTPVPQASSAPSAASYGLTGKTEAKTESFGDRVSAARQAVLDKAASVKADKADKTESRVAVRAEKEPKTSSRHQTRKARLRMSRIDPWSVMKTAFLLSIAFGIVTWVAVFIIWSAIGAAGVFDNINSTVQEVLGTPTAEPFRIENYINTGKVMGFTTLLACADVLIITALATLGSFLYNIAATLLGGLEVTLAAED
ncbi:DUF3566 domain-containing protein [Kribbella sp. NPDC026596]|uniref:DUF3566 domain-containing protein n=1 Tax=Kribbella sp. NPDC026596 TaxID=3155122 RepID=UPI0033CD069F